MANLRFSTLGRFLLLVSCGACLFWQASAEPTAQEQLEAHGLPPNLLPETVLSYKLWQTGYFEVKLDGECYSSVQYGEIPVYYAPVLTGFLGQSRLSLLKGVSVKPPKYGFFWLRVVTIYVDSSTDPKIHIGVGLGIQETFNLKDFSSEIPICEGNTVGWSSRLARLLGRISQAIAPAVKANNKRPFLLQRPDGPPWIQWERSPLAESRSASL